MAALMLGLAAVVAAVPAEAAGSAAAVPAAGAPVTVADETIVLAPAGGGSWRVLDSITFLASGGRPVTQVDVVVPGDAQDLARADGAGSSPEVSLDTVLPGSNLRARVPLHLDPGAQATVSVSWRWNAGRTLEWLRPVLYPTANLTALAPADEVRLAGVGLFTRPTQTIGGRRLVAIGASDVAEGSLLTVRASPPAWWSAHPVWAGAAGVALVAAVAALVLAGRRIRGRRFLGRRPGDAGRRRRPEGRRGLLTGR